MQKTLFILLLICSTTTFSQNQIIGKWLSENKEAVTYIYKNKGKFYGKIIWLKTPKDENGAPLTDTENPKINLQKRPILGLVILKGFNFEDNEWKGGEIYDPTNGEIYTCTMWLTDDNKLKVRGYLGVFYLTVVWTKINKK